MKCQVEIEAGFKEGMCATKAGDGSSKGRASVDFLESKVGTRWNWCN